MGIAPESHNPNRRLTALRQILSRLRDETYEKITEFRRDRDNETPSSPGDEMDQARSATDVETHASLIERAEDRLRLIDEALARVDNGSYGVCAECGEDIPLERLKALPFALYCVDCQEKRGKGRGRWGIGGVTEPYGERWTGGADMEQRDADEYRVRSPEDASGAQEDEPFGPDDGGEMGEAPKRRRGRPRKNPSKG